MRHSYTQLWCLPTDRAVSLFYLYVSQASGQSLRCLGAALKFFHDLPSEHLSNFTSHPVLTCLATYSDTKLPTFQNSPCFFRLLCLQSTTSIIWKNPTQRSPTPGSIFHPPLVPSLSPFCPGHLFPKLTACMADSVGCLEPSLTSCVTLAKFFTLLSPRFFICTMRAGIALVIIGLSYGLNG